MAQSISTPVTAAAEPIPHQKIALTGVASVFFMVGFVTVLNDILVPHLKALFQLNYTQTMLIQFTFFSAYFLVSLPAAKIISWVGYHRTIVLGLGVMGGGALLFIPAASVPSYALFLTGLYVLASGMTLLQVSVNPYAAVLGPPKGASARLTLVQALNSLGTTIGPAVGGFFILSRGLSNGQDVIADAATVKAPYLGIAAVLGVLAVIIAMIHFPKLSNVEPDHGDDAGSIWKVRHTVLGALGIFTYVGAEVAIGSFMVSYLMQPEIAGVSAQEGAHYVSFYWGGAMVGRFIGAAALRYVPTSRAVGTNAIVAFLLVVISMFTSGPVAMWSMIAVGLFNSILFPSIFTLGIHGLGKLTGKGSGLLIAAIVGGAIIPIVQGALADRIGLHPAYFLPAICYLYIMFYGFIGSRPRLQTAQAEAA